MCWHVHTRHTFCNHVVCATYPFFCGPPGTCGFSCSTDSPLGPSDAHALENNACVTCLIKEIKRRVPSTPPADNKRPAPEKSSAAKRQKKNNGAAKEVAAEEPKHANPEFGIADYRAAKYYTEIRNELTRTYIMDVPAELRVQTYNETFLAVPLVFGPQTLLYAATPQPCALRGPAHWAIDPQAPPCQPSEIPADWHLRSAQPMTLQQVTNISRAMAGYELQSQPMFALEPEPRLACRDVPGFAPGWTDTFVEYNSAHWLGHKAHRPQPSQLPTPPLDFDPALYPQGMPGQQPAFLPDQLGCFPVGPGPQYMPGEQLAFGPALQIDQYPNQMPAEQPGLDLGFNLGSLAGEEQPSALDDLLKAELGFNLGPLAGQEDLGPSEEVPEAQVAQDPNAELGIDPAIPADEQAAIPPDEAPQAPLGNDPGPAQGKQTLILVRGLPARAPAHLESQQAQDKSQESPARLPAADAASLDRGSGSGLSDESPGLDGVGGGQQQQQQQPGAGDEQVADESSTEEEEVAAAALAPVDAQANVESESAPGAPDQLDEFDQMVYNSLARALEL